MKEIATTQVEKLLASLTPPKNETESAVLQEIPEQVDQSPLSEKDSSAFMAKPDKDDSLKESEGKDSRYIRAIPEHIDKETICLTKAGEGWGL